MLKYKFTAVFEDGTVYKQNEQDKSVVDPQKSCFFDIQELTKKSELKLFHLSGDGMTYTVNMRDGHFEINGKVFNLHETDIPYFNRRLIFFRRTWRDMGKHGAVIQIAYFLGWQATKEQSLESENIKFTINVL